MSGTNPLANLQVRIPRSEYWPSYAGCGEDVPNVIAALVDWGIAIADPIATDEPSELKGPRLTAIALSDGEGVVVSGARFSQIALLQPEVLLRCQEGC